MQDPLLNGTLGRESNLDSPEDDQLMGVLARLESILNLERGLHYGLSRDYRAAERELKLAEQMQGNNPSFHDLRARLFAQQGLFNEAETSWTTALQLDPDNEAYVAGLARVRGDIDRPPLLRWPLSVLATFFIGALVVTLALAAFRYAYQIDASVSALATQVENIPLAQELHDESTSDDLEIASGEISDAISDSSEILEDVLDTVGTSLASIFSEISELKAQQSDMLSEQLRSEPTTPALRVDGVRLEPAGKGYRILFDEALFAEGATLDPPSMNLLSEVGTALAGIRGDFRIVITGFVDGTESADYRPTTLHLLRSAAVAKFLAENTNLLEADLVIGFPSDRVKPYPEDTMESAFRNRTVVIDLIPLEG